MNFMIDLLSGYYDSAANFLLYTQFGASVFVLLLLSFIKAPYGRFSRGGWGPVINPRIGWIFMESPAVIMILLFFLGGGNMNNLVVMVFFGIWQLHYVQRTFVYPLLLSSASKKMALSIVLFGFLFNFMNGYINGYFIFASKSVYTVEWLTSFRFILGAGIFLIGWLLNIHSDSILRHLRKPGETGYKVPQKGSFRWITSPNYLGEILEWIGWAVLTWSVAGLAFAVFTIANLAPRAHFILKWYRENFDDFPEDRKALIPFIY